MINPRRIRISKPLTAFALAIVVSFSALPVKTHAQMPVIDVANLAANSMTAGATGNLTAKEGFAGIGLDGLAWMLVKNVVIPSLTRSTVNWINSGFNGSPSYVTDLKSNMVSVADAAAEGFFAEVANGVAAGIITSPYQEEILQAVRTGYYLSTGGSFAIQNPFTLDQYSPDPQAFYAGDFSQGGFDALHALVMNPQNNPYSAYQLAVDELGQRVGNAQAQRATELSWGNGFLSFRGDCVSYGPGSSQQAQLSTLQPGATLEDTTVTTQSVSLIQNDNCIEHEILTPGTVIANKLNHTLGLAEDSLVTADEINEILGAVFTQLVNKVMGSEGLIGVSQPSSGGGRSALDQTITGTGSTGGTQSTVTRQQLNTYISNWQTIDAGASAALQRCPSSPLANNTHINAATEIAQATNAIAVLQQAGRNSSQLSTIAPTATEMSNAQFNAQNAPGSLVSQLNAVQACGSN